MDSYEATKIVFSRIQALDPENASKITGYVLIQEHGEKEMIRLAFGPETLLVSLIQRAKVHLGISSSIASSCELSSSSSPFSPMSITKPSSLQSPRINNFTQSNFSSSPWHVPSLIPNSSSTSPSYAAVVNGTTNSTSSLSSSSTHSTSPDLLDEFKFPDSLSFLNESTTTDFIEAKSFSPYAVNSSSWIDSVNSHNQNHHLHRRSFSLSDACLGSEDSSSSIGWKPCLFYARGFCKNGSSCKFLHGGFVDSLDSPTAVIGSPAKIDVFDQCHELLRSKSAVQQHQRLSATSHLMSGGGASFPYNKCSNYLMTDAQRSAAAAIVMADEFHRFGKRNDFSSVALSGSINPGSRQIYLTFPADSTFREEDVSNYFSIYGPVQDVRIPYQQKRMFGFVTFVYPETVKVILAKGNPHFVCDSRVLVKPYKEKGKIPEKKHQLHGMHSLERMDYPCSSPTGFDDLGGRMYYNSPDLIFRRKMEEQVDMQQAIELQGRRLMNLQLLDLKNLNNRYVHHLSPKIAIPSPTQSPNSLNPALISANHESHEDTDVLINPVMNSNFIYPSKAVDQTDSLEHVLPENLFASPKKSASQNSVFTIREETIAPNNNFSKAPCSFQLPRFATDHGAIEM